MMVLIPFGLQSKQHHHDQASKNSYLYRNKEISQEM